MNIFRTTIILTILSVCFAETTVASSVGKRPLLKAYLGESRKPVAPLNAITQAQLRFLGYYSGRIDNDFGPNSKAALKRFQVAVGLPSHGIINRSSVRALEKRVDQKAKRLTGKDLNGEWAKLGNCSRRSVEVRGNTLIKRHRGRLSVPRLDFFEFSSDEKLFFMITGDRANFSVSKKGFLKAEPITSWLVPKEKPVEQSQNIFAPKPKPTTLHEQANAFERCD